MAKYTQTLPKLTYNGVTISDITHRIDLLKAVRKYETMYYSVKIAETMTPEKLAETIMVIKICGGLYVLLIKSLTPFMIG